INTPSLLREMEFAYRVARMKGGVPAREIFEMALRGRRLSDSDAPSGIRVGARADLVILDLPGGPTAFASLVRASASHVRLAGFRRRREAEVIWTETCLGMSDLYYLIETTTILPETPPKATGHVDPFSELLVTCTRCGESYRGDQLLEGATHEEHEGLTHAELDARIRELKIRCPNCKGELGPARPFNMMFPLDVGPTGKDRAYLRPETAQGVYLNFRREFEALRRKLPMGLAIVGRAYRNEISPRQGAYRMREFLQAELQIFFDPATFADGLRFDAVASTPIRIAWATEKNQPGAHDIAAKDLVARDLPPWYAYHLAAVLRFFFDGLQVPRDAFRFAELDEKERAFYNKIHFDIQVKQESLGGFKEVGGVHYRSDHDLKGHEAMSHLKQSVTFGGSKLIPHV